MDDFDLGENVESHAETAEAQLDRPGQRFENDEAHLDPSRWWFASSAFPMIAGTLGPVASAFSICALVRPWRQHYLGHDLEQSPFLEDPPWLTIVNAFQLVVALVSNAFLLLNMTRRVRFSIAQPITIIGWYVSVICLVVLTATAAGPLKEGIHPVHEYIWSQAFYYGIWAAVLYFIVASLMVITFYGATTNHYDRDFALTPSQRTLMLQTIMFLGYLLIGALVFSKIEGWNYLDGVYFADVTLFTVGFGDYAPSSVLGRALVMPYALVGIISLGLVIGSIRSLVLERGRRRLDARLEEKKRRKKVRAMTLKGDDDILQPIQSDSGTSPASQQAPATEFERRKAEFEIMRKIQKQIFAQRRWMAMAISTSTALVLWLVGAYVFYESEKRYQPDWNYFKAFFFCFTTLTTVGYGDLHPISNAGKSFFVFWSLLALPTMTVLISNAGDTVVKFIRDGTIRLGNITILPGEGGVMRDFKHIINTLTFKRVFPSHSEPVLARSQDNQHDQENDNDDDSNHEMDIPGFYGAAEDEDTRGRRHRPPSTYTTKVRRSISRIRNHLEELPTGTNLHFLIISEIQIMSQHVRDSHPRRYTYEEWAWYLRLIGEDERSPDTHRKAKPRTKHHHGSAEKTRDNEAKWSWVGNRSPLMGSQEESEWILERLLERLKDLLSAEGKRRQAED